MLTQPGIGRSSRPTGVWSYGVWPLYILLLLAVEVPRRGRLYGSPSSWGWFMGKTPNVTRAAEEAQVALTVFFLALGFATLAAYIKLGIEHAPKVGERYTPAWVQRRSQMKVVYNRRARHRRRPRRAAAGGRREAPRPPVDHPLAGAAEASHSKRAGGMQDRRNVTKGIGDTRTSTSRTRSAAATGAPDQDVVRMFVNTAPKAVPSWRPGACRGAA